MVVKSAQLSSYQNEYNTQLSNYTNATVPDEIAVLRFWCKMREQT